MIRVLDIDLDLFLADCCPLAAPGERPALQGHEPWPEEKVRLFLEKGCGLHRHAPLPGRVFDTHDKALLYWQELIRSGRLETPFSVTHCDAHSDLGIGYPGPGIVLNGVLPVRFPARLNTEAYYKRKQLDEANYLLFALAFRYIGALENIRNPLSRQDKPPSIFNENGTVIHLSSQVSRLFESVNGSEPFIPYSEWTDPLSYVSPEPFSFISVAQSPRYAPKEADALLNVMREYIMEE